MTTTLRVAPRLGLMLSAAAMAVACAPADVSEAAPETDTQATPPPFETTEVADGVYRFRWASHNTLVVRTSEGLVAFDPISVDAAAVFVDEIRRVEPDIQLRAIVYSHRHADHATGAGVLRSAFGAEVPIVAHENALAPLIEAADPDLPPPSVTFTDELSLVPGEVELHYLGRSHSDDIAVAYLPEHDVAFAVDFVASDRFGYQDLSSFHFPDMFTAIEGLLEIPFETIEFGHGPPGDRATIERQLTYYRDLDRLVREAVANGLSEDETAASVVLSDYSHWDRYDDWRELNVRGMHRKITAEQ